MSGLRLDSAGSPARDKALPFSFDGRAMQGLSGDTIASALMANGVRIIGRSFKYHRPRGLWGAWFDEPNAIFSVTLGKTSLPNVPGATTLLEAGMQIRSVNAWPNAQHDVKSVLDWFHRFLSAGFYYKTFMRPDWHMFEPMIRKMAGLGALDPSLIDGYRSEQFTDHCDVLVVGGGAAGLVAAQAAAQSGKSVWLVEDHRDPGGGLFRRGTRIEGQPASAWITARRDAIETAGGRVMTRTTAFGAYDHGMFALIRENGFGVAPILIRLRARNVILATGSIDRPVTFANNDLPGILGLEAGLEYLHRYGVLPGRRIAIVANHANVETARDQLAASGAEVELFDPALSPVIARGRKGISRLTQGARGMAVDTALCSAGWVPMIQLWCHAGGKLDWDDAIAAFVPGAPPKGMQAVGAAAGHFDLDFALEDARAVGAGTPRPALRRQFSLTPLLPDPQTKGRQWIDFQHDVTLKDIALAARENYVSVEHLKRYTTLGMASDQGKTSNIAGLAAMARIQGKTIPEMGTTTFRPPIVPVPFELYRGHHRAQQFRPLKRLCLETRHRDAGAAFGEYGGWLRPGWYGDKPAHKAAQDEARMVRQTGGILDASALGKIEVMGPDARAFVNFVYYNTMTTLRPGQIRYGFMLTEQGVVYDDGVVQCLHDTRFVISCSSSHVDGVAGMLESWRQDGNDPDRIFVHNTTDQWATLTVTGPQARDLMEVLVPDLDLCDATFAHMSGREILWNDTVLRIARVSFTGEQSYEISIAASRAPELWDALLTIGAGLGISPFGLEALSILRAEKGYIIIGKDTDGQTMPHDLGFTAQRHRKSTPFVGDRGLHTEVANDPDRRQLVGLIPPKGGAKLATGAHIVQGTPPRSIGIVTSSYDSPNLGHPIALALIANGAERMGETVTVWHLGQETPACITSPVFFDPEGARLHAQ